ncbi:MAG TPA: hypothetical protein VK886_22750 [Vicinamibacterales bacterium]|nr:hypothetical protein [Vicinamibacterales bacterium]
MGAPQHLRFASASVLVGLLSAASPQLHADQAVRQLLVRADVQTRTSLRVSADTLVMTIVPDSPDRSGTRRHSRKTISTIEYVASARTRSDGEVLLAVECGPVHGPGGASDVGTELSIAGGDQGEIDALGGPAVAARWIGSGVRRGTIRFMLRAPLPGRYAVPVRLVLTAP